MIKEAIEKIQGLVEAVPQVKEFFDRQYSTRKFEPVMPPHDPTLPVLELDTLTGLVDFLKSGFDGKEVGYFPGNEPQLVGRDFVKVALHVTSPTRVVAFLPVDGFYKVREAVCSAIWGEETFPFDTFMGQEEFVIKALATIEDGYDLPSVMELAGKIVCEDKAEMSDNGVTQAVTVQRGVKVEAGKILPIKPTLAPIRTFVEIDQPSSRFVFRMRSEPVTLALFEADCGAWKMVAKRRIKEYLEQQLPGVPVFL